MKALISEVGYNLVRRPLGKVKKGAGTVELVVNGNPEICKFTTNRGFCKVAADTLDYIWIDFDGSSWFLTLDYGVAASSLAGAEISIVEGTAERKDPVRKATGREDRELARKAGFDSWVIANRAPKVAETPEA